MGSSLQQPSASPTGLKDQQVLDVRSYAHLFARSVDHLKARLAEKGDGGELVWDKVRTSSCHGCFLNVNQCLLLLIN